MSFWSKLGHGLLKVAPIAAGIAAPFTGGASLAALTALGGVTGAINGAEHGGGLKGALLGGAMGAAPGVLKGVGAFGSAANAAGGATSAGGVTGAVAHGSKFANLLSAAPKILTATSSLLGGGPAGQAANVQHGVVAGTMADQAAQNRLKEAQVAQGGPAVDAAALSNVLRSGRIADYTPPSAANQALFDKYGKRLAAPNATSMQFAKSMQDELARRMAAGEPLTLSGVPAAGAQETADNAAARAAAMNGGQPGGVAGVLDAGANIAKMAPSFIDLMKQFQALKGSGTPAITGAPSYSYLDDPNADQGS